MVNRIWQKTLALSSERKHPETFCFSSSLQMNAKAFLKAKHSHWEIENRLNWVLDTAFCEDLRRVRKEHAPQKSVVLRHMAVNLLKQEKTVKGGLHAKRLLTGGRKPTCSKFYPFEMQLPYSILERMVYNSKD